MKKLLITTLSFFIIVLFCHAQNSDTAHGRFALSLNAGINFPTNDYAKSSAYIGSYPTKEVFGFSITGYAVNVAGTYILSQNIGVYLRVGADVNQSNYLTQYLAGFTLYAFPTMSEVNLFLSASAGLVEANIKTSTSFSENSGLESTVGDELPGAGNGFGFYLGAGGMKQISKKLFLSLSAGYAGAGITFPNGVVTSTTFSNSYPFGVATTAKQTMTMTIGVIELTLGASYHFGK